MLQRPRIQKQCRLFDSSGNWAWNVEARLLFLQGHVFFATTVSTGERRQEKGRLERLGHTRKWQPNRRGWTRGGKGKEAIDHTKCSAAPRLRVGEARDRVSFRWEDRGRKCSWRGTQETRKRDIIIKAGYHFPRSKPFQYTQPPRARDAVENRGDQVQREQSDLFPSFLAFRPARARVGLCISSNLSCQFLTNRGLLFAPEK